jgi:hypothetical protein
MYEGGWQLAGRHDAYLLLALTETQILSFMTRILHNMSEAQHHQLIESYYE